MEGNGIDVLDNGHTLYRSGGTSSRAGVGILVNKNIVRNIDSYQFFSNRVVSLRILLTGSRNSRGVSIICCYAPTLQRSTANPVEADEFYSLLSKAVGNVNRRDVLWVLGDMNAKVGSSPADSSNPVGMYSKHRMGNDNGSRVIEFCEIHHLLLANTMFKHRMQHRATWFADGLCHNDGNQVGNMILSWYGNRTCQLSLTRGHMEAS